MWTPRTRVVRPLRIGDLSSPHGGRHDRHGSHRAGRDADVIFYATDAAGTPTRGRGWLAYDRFGAAREPLEDGRPGRVFFFDDARNWAFVRALLLDPAARVQWLFVSSGVKARLLRYAPRTSPSARRSTARAKCCTSRAAGTRTPTTSTCASRAGCASARWAARTGDPSGPGCGRAPCTTRQSLAQRGPTRGWSTRSWV
jgi:hypothetical protein